MNSLVALFFISLYILKFVSSYTREASCLRVVSTRFGKPHQFQRKFTLSVTEDEDENKFTTKQILKEETESPFRNIRFFLYFSLIGAASIGTFITGLQLIAILTGARNGNIDVILPNFGVNLLGIPLIGYLWNREKQARDGKLTRIQRGGSLAGLRVKVCSDDDDILNVKLSDMRRNRGMEKRLVLTVARKELLSTSLESSLALSDDIIKNNILIVPLQIAGKDSSSYTIEVPELDVFRDTNANSTADTQTEGVSSILKRYKHIGLPQALPAWNSVLKKELSTALSQQENALDKGITIVIKTNGKVASRKFGVPLWESFLNGESLASNVPPNSGSLDFRKLNF